MILNRDIAKTKFNLVRFYDSPFTIWPQVCAIRVPMEKALIALYGSDGGPVWRGMKRREYKSSFSNYFCEHVILLDHLSHVSETDTKKNEYSKFSIL